MPEVVPKESEAFEKTLRRFRRKVQSEGIMGEVRRRKAALSTGEKRRAKHRAALAKARRRARRVTARRRAMGLEEE